MPASDSRNFNLTACVVWWVKVVASCYIIQRVVGSIFIQDNYFCDLQIVVLSFQISDHVNCIPYPLYTWTQGLFRRAEVGFIKKICLIGRVFDSFLLLY